MDQRRRIICAPPCTPGAGVVTFGKRLPVSVPTSEVLEMLEIMEIPGMLGRGGEGGE